MHRKAISQSAITTPFLKGARPTLLLIPMLIAVLSQSVFAAPGASLSASPSACALSPDEDHCVVTLNYTVSDIEEGRVVRIQDDGLHFLRTVSSPDGSSQGSISVQVWPPGYTFGVVENFGLESHELLASVSVNVEQEEYIVEPEPSASLSVSPNPCQIAAVGGDDCYVDVSYSTTALPDFDIVGISDRGERLWAAFQGGDGNRSDTIRIQILLPGETFELRHGATGEVFASVFANVERTAPQGPVTGSFGTPQNPCELTEHGGTCAQSLDYEVENTSDATVWRSDDNGLTWYWVIRVDGLGVWITDLTEAGSLFELRAGADRSSTLLDTASLWAVFPTPDPVPAVSLEVSKDTCYIEPWESSCRVFIEVQARHVDGVTLLSSSNGGSTYRTERNLTGNTLWRLTFDLSHGEWVFALRQQGGGPNDDRIVATDEVLITDAPARTASLSASYSSCTVPSDSNTCAEQVSINWRAENFTDPILVFTGDDGPGRGEWVTPANHSREIDGNVATGTHEDYTWLGANRWAISERRHDFYVGEIIVMGIQGNSPTEDPGDTLPPPDDSNPPQDEDADDDSSPPPTDEESPEDNPVGDDSPVGEAEEGGGTDNSNDQDTESPTIDDNPDDAVPDLENSDIETASPCEQTSEALQAWLELDFAYEQRIPMANPASNQTRQSVIRFVNLSDESNSIEVVAIDDLGMTNAESISINLLARQSLEISIRDFESGLDLNNTNAGFCNGSGKWQLIALSHQPFEVSSILNTAGELPSEINSVVPKFGDYYKINFFNPSSNQDRLSFIRIVNNEQRSGTVQLRAIDDSGMTYEPQTILMAPLTSSQINASDLENGNAQKGLDLGIGDGDGKWRLTAHSDLDLSIMSLVRIQGGFLQNMSRPAPGSSDGLEKVLNLVFPASDTTVTSFIRVVNESEEMNVVQINAVDELGQPGPGGAVSMTLSPSESRQFKAVDLEHGNLEKGLFGAIGEGAGNWRITLVSEYPFEAMSLIRDAEGLLSNLSSAYISGESGVAIDRVYGADDDTSSILRFSNPSGIGTMVTVSGIDENGITSSEDQLSFSLESQILELSSDELESGNAGKGINGRLGDGSGTWRLTVSSEREVYVQHLIRTSGGQLINVSSH